MGWEMATAREKEPKQWVSITLQNLKRYIAIVDSGSNVR